MKEVKIKYVRVIFLGPSYGFVCAALTPGFLLRIAIADVNSRETSRYFVCTINAKVFCAELIPCLDRLYLKCDFENNSSYVDKILSCPAFFVFS